VDGAGAFDPRPPVDRARADDEVEEHGNIGRIRAPPWIWSSLCRLS
jgi:hypothetical protein